MEDFFKLRFRNIGFQFYHFYSKLYVLKKKSCKIKLLHFYQDENLKLHNRFNLSLHCGDIFKRNEGNVLPFGKCVEVFWMFTYLHARHSINIGTIRPQQHFFLLKTISSKDKKYSFKKRQFQDFKDFLILANGKICHTKSSLISESFI